MHCNKFELTFASCLNMYYVQSKWDQSYSSQVLQIFEKRCSPKAFGQTKNELVSGRLACTSSKTEISNKIGI